MTSSELPSDLPQQLSQELAQAFDYAALNTETQIVVQRCTNEIKQRLQDISKSTWEIGQKLFEIRECLGYGLFCAWLELEFEWSLRTAYSYISVFESFTFATLAKVEVATAALYLLAASSTPQEARTEAIERALAGEKITKSKAKALIKQYKQSAAQKVIKQVTLDVVAETVEESTFSDQKALVDAELSVELMDNSLDDVGESEQELLGKELGTKPLFKSSNSEQAVPSDALNGFNKDQKATQIQQGNTSVTEICKNLTATIEYFYREDLIDLLDPLSLKTLVEKLNLLVEKTEVSLKKRFNSSYSNN